MRIRKIDLIMLGLTSCTLFIFYWIFMTKTVTAVSSTTAEQSSTHSLLVDAGSSGSRLFVYCIEFNAAVASEDIPTINLCKDSMNQPIVKKVNPGISSFASDQSGLRAYISDLVSVAAEHIPKELHPVTPIYILATAGMRLLTDAQQEIIWSRVREVLKQEFNFKFQNSWAHTVTGYYEALYGWITVNYLLGKFAIGTTESTVGVLDMGGASMQIAFEVSPGLQVPEHLIMNFTIGRNTSMLPRTYHVYVMTFLGFGMQAARSRYKLLLLYDAMEHSQYKNLLRARFRSLSLPKYPPLPATEVRVVYSFDDNEKFLLSDPCIQSGLEDALTLQDLAQSRHLKIVHQSAKIPEVLYKGTGNLSACAVIQKKLLRKKRQCSLSPCSIDGVHQPLIDFSLIHFYGMSEYWYTSSEMQISDTTYKLDSFNRSADSICQNPWEAALSKYRADGVDASSIAIKKTGAWYIVETLSCKYNQIELFEPMEEAIWNDRAHLYEEPADWLNSDVVFRPPSAFHRIGFPAGDVTNNVSSASWIMNVLHTGFEFPRDYAELRPVEQLRGIDVQWSLGALIYFMKHPPADVLDASRIAMASDRWDNLNTTRIISFILLFSLVACFLLLSLLLCRRSSTKIVKCLLWSKRCLPRRWSRYYSTARSSGIAGASSRSSGVKSSYVYTKISSPPPLVSLESNASDIGRRSLGTDNFNTTVRAPPTNSRSVNPAHVNFRHSFSLPSLSPFGNGSDEGFFNV